MTEPHGPTSPTADAPHYDLLVIGLGYVGLPLAQAASAAGLVVCGLDTSESVVSSLREGRSHIDDMADADVGQMLSEGFIPTTDPTVVSQARAITICVPTPLTTDRTPDLRAVRTATATIAEGLAPQTLVVLESTTYPGTTEEVLLPELARDGKQVGADFFLAFSPERVDPGNPSFGIRNTPKIIGGVTNACTERAQALYGRFVNELVVAKGTREAEMAKLLENTYRHVNIALVNELAQFAHEMDIDIWDVIRCAATKPFGFHAFYPGPGVGGHCIPIDPSYLSFRVRSTLGTSFRFVDLAEEINAAMPRYVVQRVQNQLNRDGIALKGAHVLLVGVTYKPDVADTRETPAREIAERFVDMGAVVSYFDPFVDEWLVSGVIRSPDLTTGAELADICVLLQSHSSVDGTVLGAAIRVFDARGHHTGPSIERL